MTVTYVVNYEDINGKEAYPLKGFSKEEDAIAFMDKRINDILEKNSKYHLLTVNERHKSIFLDDKTIVFIFWIRRHEDF